MTTNNAANIGQAIVFPITAAQGGTGVVNASTITLAGALVTSGANSITFTSTGPTTVTLPTSGTLCTTVGSSSIVTVGTIATGVWNGTIVTGTYGGTGINNGANTITLGGNLTTSGSFNTTLTVTAGTNVTLPTSGTLVNSAVATLSSLTSVGTIGTGVWQGTLVGSTYGGTGVNNGSSTITLAGNLVTSGANSITFTSTGPTTVTLPTSGTLCTTVGSSSIVTVGTIATGVWNGTAVDVAHGGTGKATFTAYSVVCAGTTSTGIFQNVSGVGSSGQVLTSNGASALPTWQAASAPTATPIFNVIIGGNFDTNPWQNGTSFSLTGNGTQVRTADCWLVQLGGIAALTLSRSTTVPTVAQAGILTNNSFKAAVTTADNSISANDYLFIRQAIEGYNWAQIAQIPFTISFWIYATVTGTQCVSIVGAGQTVCYTHEFTITTTLTWQLVTVTIPASPSAGTWQYTTQVGAYLYFPMACGSTYQNSSADSWNTTINPGVATSNQVNHLATIGNVFQIALVQINAGSSASAFQYRSAQEELSLCQRYLCKSFQLATAPAQAVGAGTSEQLFEATKAGAVASRAPFVSFPVTMRISPTITLYNPVNANAQVYDETASADCTSSTDTNTTQRGFALTYTGNASTAVGGVLGYHWVASAEQ